MYLGEHFAAAADCSLKPDQTLMASSPRIEELRKKFEENPRRYFAPLANEYRKSGDIEQAIAICREYLPQQPGHMSGHIVYGQALYEARQVDEAKSVFETALSLDPENLIALRHLGDIALMVGDSPGARMWYGRVLEADPRNEEIQAQLARLDQTDAATPTPVVSPQVEPEEQQPPLTDKAEVAASSKPTPSSAPTVVVSAMRVPQKPDLATTLQPTPAVPRPEIEKSVHEPIGLEPTSMAAPPQETFGTQPTVPLDVSIVEQVARQREAPPIDSFSLEGLETTSMAPEEAAPSAPPPASPIPETAAPDVAQAETAPIDIPTLELAEIPVAEPAAPPAAQAASPEPTPPSDDLPLLDIGELPSPSEAAAPAPLPEPITERIPQPDPEPVPESVSAPVAELSFDSSVPESGPFVTETMAELYLHQGHHEEALRVYRALLEQRPGDQRLLDKIAALTSTSPAVPVASPAAPAAPPVPRAGRTMRDVLAAIAVRRPSGSSIAPVHAANGVATPEPAMSDPTPEPTPELTEEPIAEPRSEPAPELASTHAAVVPEQKPRPDDRLASLFGAYDTAAGDESAAMVLSQAFTELNGLEQGRAADVTGAPARPANSELSLDAVFKSDESGKPAPSTFSFDQFFSQRATTEHATPASGATTEARPRDDATQFTQWLEGLKQR
jgi:Flp pilus assembly protein TadD